LRIITMLLAVAAIAVAGCGSSSSSSSSSGSTQASTTSTSGGAAATAKFAVHAGLAAGTFYQFIYKPLKNGELKKPLEHKLTAVKAVAAAAFIAREASVAAKYAKEVPTLAKAAAAVAGLAAAVKGGVSLTTVDESLVQQGNSEAEKAKEAAQQAGTPIVEKAGSIGGL